MLNRFARLVLAGAVGLLLLAAPVLRADTLHLKDGRVLEGRIVREGEGFVYFATKVGSIEKPELFTKDQIVKLVKEGEAPTAPPAPKGQGSAGVPAPKPEQPAPAPAAAAGAAAAGAAGAAGTDKAKDPPSTDDGATRVCFISIEEEVGMLLNADAIEHSVDLVKDQKPDVIVLVVNSGGGALLEVEPLSDLIHKKLKKNYRTVAWIRSAISAAAMTALNCEEIYMMREGNLGGATAFTRDQSGRTKAAEGEALEHILELGKELARRGGRNPLIVKAMQVFTDLSCDIDENGVITWYENKQGKYIVSTKDRILTFNSSDALKYGVSRGTADTKDELMKIMGISEWKEVGPEADQYQQQFRANVTSLQARAGELMNKYTMAVNAAQSASGDEKERARYVGRARGVLAELRALVKRAPSFEKYTQFQKEWFEAREEDLRRLLAGKGLPSGGGGGGGLGGG